MKGYSVEVPLQIAFRERIGGRVWAGRDEVVLDNTDPWRKSVVGRPIDDAHERIGRRLANSQRDSQQPR